MQDSEKPKFGTVVKRKKERKREKEKKRYGTQKGSVERRIQFNERVEHLLRDDAYCH